MIKVLTVHPLPDYNEFKLEYKGDINPYVDWANLKTCKVGMTIYDGSQEVYLPAYEHGGWFGGKPIKVVPGKVFAVLRVPCVKFGKKYIVLDGVHKIRELKPKFLILDYLDPALKDRELFLDAHNHYHREVLNVN